MKEDHTNKAATASAPAPSPNPTSIPTPEQLQVDNSTEELNEENEVLEEAKAEQDLYDEIFRLSQTAATPGQEEESYGLIKEKLERFKIIMTKKDNLLEKTRNNVKELRNDLKLSKHNNDLMKEVEENQSKDLDVAEKENEKLKRDLKTQKDRNKDILVDEKMTKNTLKKGKKALENELKNVRNDIGALHKETCELKIKLDVKENIIKNLKEASGEDDLEEVEVTEPTEPFRHVSQAHNCNACDKVFNSDENLEEHMDAMHTEKQCIFCDKICINSQELVEHHKKCNNIDMANSKCYKCKEMFTYQGLKRHKQNCHSGTESMHALNVGKCFKVTMRLRNTKIRSTPWK